MPWIGQAGSWGPDGETTPNYASFSILPALNVTGGIGDRELCMDTFVLHFCVPSC